MNSSGAITELSLFSGAGGGLLGTHLLGWRPIGYVEFNDYCQRVIAARIRDGILPSAPIYGDIRAFISEGYAASYTGMVDVVTGGFPCQPFSNAGRRQGVDDPRNMWPATIECLRVVRPRFALLENVPGLLSSGYFGTIVGDLAASGFDCRWRVLSAAEMGAPHKRDRLWIVCNSKRFGFQRDNWRRTGEEFTNRRSPVAYTQSFAKRESTDETDAFATGWQTRHELGYSRQYATDSDQQGLAQRNGSATKGRARPALDRCSWWAVEPDVGRVANGMAYRVERLTALGNGQVPAVVAAAWELMTQMQEGESNGSLARRTDS